MIRVIGEAGVSAAEDRPPRPHKDPIALDNHWWGAAAFTTRVHMVVVYDTNTGLLRAAGYVTLCDTAT